MEAPSPENPPDPRQEFLLRLNSATPHAAVTPLLLTINVAVFLLMTVLGISLLGGRADEYLRFGANFAPLTSGGEWWRLLTCTFVHFGILHLVLNMWALWDAGQLTEKLFGNAWFAVLYLFAGAAGSLASLLWNPQTISAGASGAIFGVLGALLAYVTVQRGSIPPDVINRLRISASIFVTYSLFYGFAKAGVDNAAHLGGLAGGFVMGLIAARPLHPHARGDGNIRRAVLAATLAAVTLPGAALLAPDTARVYRQAIGLQKEIDWFIAEEGRLNTLLQSVADRTRSGNISDATALNELRTAILPAWNEAVARLARVEIDARAPARKDYDLLMQYAVARQDMIKAVADYMATNNPAQKQRVADLRVQADQALKQYQNRQKK